jgi:hypothetical protein
MIKEQAVFILCLLQLRSKTSFPNFVSNQPEFMSSLNYCLINILSPEINNCEAP